MGHILPLPADGTVMPDGTGLVRFRAMITDAGANMKQATITVNGSSASMFGSPTPLTFIGAAVDCRNRLSGSILFCNVTARDYAGNVSSASVTVALRKVSALSRATHRRRKK
jgi:hypothetical protein